VAVWKGEYQEDPFKGTDKGKSSHASFAENQVTSHEIADRNATTIKVPHEIIKDPLETLKHPCTPDKSDKRKVPSG
jgi:hypothetical protein